MSGVGLGGVGFGNAPGQTAGPSPASAGGSYTTDQWIRKWQLVVYNPYSANATAPGTALVLSAGSDAPNTESLRCTFQITGTMIPTPNTAVIRVYNPSPETVNRVLNEYVRVTLSAGYLSGRFGTIFDGWIMQFRFGGETAVDKYLEIQAQDGDLGFNYSTVSRTLMPGFNSPQSIGEAIAAAMKNAGVTPGDLQHLGIVPTARPVVIWGSVVDHMDALTRTTNTMWSIQKGQMVVIPTKGANVASEKFTVNALTGLIGFPTLTNDGLEFRTLLNPFAAIGQVVRINNAEINQVVAGVGGGRSSGISTVVTPQLGVQYYATTSDDGTYFVANVGFVGDTRGQDWYSDFVGVTINPDTYTLGAAQGLFPQPSQVSSQEGTNSPVAGP